MAILNERNENTKGIIHLLTTTLCNRDCKYCCNKQYDMNEILYVTDSELREAHTLCLTGGEPFLYTDPCAMAKHYKMRYRNIQNVLECLRVCFGFDGNIQAINVMECMSL